MSSRQNLTAGDGNVGGRALIGCIGRVAIDAPQGSRKRTTRNGSEEIDRRHQRFSREVAEGKRSALSLIAIPAALAKSSTVTYPLQPFGEPQEW
jgi:hypothetical protein